MGLDQTENRSNWAKNPDQYFEEYGKFGFEFKLSRDIAIRICEESYGRGFWVLGIDCGTIVDGTKYRENPDEGFVSKFKLMSSLQKENFDKGFASRFDLYNNNQSAKLAILEIDDTYDAFVLVIQKISWID